MKALQPVVAALSLTVIFAAGVLPHGSKIQETPAYEPVSVEAPATTDSRVSPETPQDEVKDLTF